MNLRLALAPLCLLLGACASPDPDRLVDRAGVLQFADVPIPAGYKLASDPAVRPLQSLIYECSPPQAKSVEELKDYYERELPKHEWESLKFDPEHQNAPLSAKKGKLNLTLHLRIPSEWAEGASEGGKRVAEAAGAGPGSTRYLSVSRQLR